MTKCLLCDKEWDGKTPLCLIELSRKQLIPGLERPTRSLPANDVMQCTDFVNRVCDQENPMSAELLKLVPGLPKNPPEEYGRTVVQAFAAIWGS